MKQEHQTKASLQDYFASEVVAEGKHEFNEGRIVAMSGGSINHSRITTNLLCTLNPELRKKDKGCEAYNSDLRIFIEKANSVVYPDLSVICGSPSTHKDDSETATNPILIIEVLSKSTAAYDRGGKFFKYRTLPSLREYVLVNQNKMCVETFYKENEGDWRMRTFLAEDEAVYLSSLDISLPLTEIYRNVRNLKEV